MSTLHPRPPRPRGATHADRVSVKKRARPERHVQRKEERVSRLNDRKQANLHTNIVKCFSRSDEFLPLKRIRKFASKTRAYCRAYCDGQPNSLADVEKLIKVYKSHRSAEVFDKKFCHECQLNACLHVICAYNWSINTCVHS